MIAQSTIERIREADIYSVVSHFVELKKSGANYKGKSPFTNEKTPSFYVTPAKNIFKCFSSGNGGDAIRFVMLHENCGYVEAIEKIASIIGERIEYERPATDEEKARYTEEELLYKINAAAAKQYAQALQQPGIDANHPAFISLINRRRFSPDTILQWQIGYAPDQWDFLTQTLKEKALVDPGKKLALVKEKDGKVFDSFRHRIVFPIHDHKGRIAGFGAGILPHSKTNYEDAPKYLNSSDSAIYAKSSLLFGLHFAIHAIRKVGYAFLMEGYTDVISFHQAGYNNAVGTCGTALTPQQATLLKKYTAKVVIVGDPDHAGQEAVVRAIPILLSVGFEITVMSCPMVLQLKLDDKPTNKNPNPQPFRELVFLKAYDKKKKHYTFLHNKQLLEVEEKEIADLAKIDPDELVRLFPAQNTD
ncbi:MAG: DNA primase [Pseudomonadota bacterium]|jgi:DNA primase